MNGDEIVVLIASPLEPTPVERIRAVDSRIQVVHRPDLVGAPRHTANPDHATLRAMAGPGSR